MKENKKLILEGMKPIAKKLGYKKNGATFTKEFPEVIAFLNVQTSQWSDKYYMNWGICVRSLCEKTKPNSYDCQIDGRFDSYIGHEYLDFESQKIPNEQKVLIICKYLDEKGFPFLEDLSTLEKIKKFIIENNYLVVKKTLREII